MSCPRNKLVRINACCKGGVKTMLMLMLMLMLILMLMLVGDDAPGCKRRRYQACG